MGSHTDLSFGNPDWLQPGLRIRLARPICRQQRTIWQRTPWQPHSITMTDPVSLVIPIDYRENPLLTQAARSADMREVDPFHLHQFRLVTLGACTA